MTAELRCHRCGQPAALEAPATGEPLCRGCWEAGHTWRPAVPDDLIMILFARAPRVSLTRDRAQWTVTADWYRGRAIAPCTGRGTSPGEAAEAWALEAFVQVLQVELSGEGETRPRWGVARWLDCELPGWSAAAHFEEKII